MSYERVAFRLIQMPCCGQLLCWVNPRFPNYCPECGKYCFHVVRSCVLKTDENAELKVKDLPTTPFPIVDNTPGARR